MVDTITIKRTALAYQDDPQLGVMNFLNEVAEKFPNAISFASGRPAEVSFDVPKWLKNPEVFADFCMKTEGKSRDAIFRSIAQYGKTAGIINKLVAQSLTNDEGIETNADNILVTNGAQEAMALCLSVLFKPGRDVLLVTDPTYIGITALARIQGIRIEVVESDSEGPRIAHLQEVTTRIKQSGLEAPAFYLIPDFNNPVGTSISLARRMELLNYARDFGLLLLEDNPYGLFHYGQQKLPTLKSLDSRGDVIYIGTFSKTVCPSLRVGYLVSEQMVEHDGHKTPLISEFSKVKSLLSVNTGQIAQAIVAGVLIENDCSLIDYVRPLKQLYKNNRDFMLKKLHEVFNAPGNPLYEKVQWNYPQGGFFITLKLPFNFSEEDVYDCAGRFGVLCMPLNFFSVEGNYNDCIRLSFSYVSEAQIAKGVQALSDFLSLKIREEA